MGETAYKTCRSIKVRTRAEAAIDTPAQRGDVEGAEREEDRQHAEEVEVHGASMRFDVRNRIRQMDGTATGHPTRLRRQWPS
jgi:hypothetical protein